MSAARAQNESRPALVGALTVMIVEALVVLPLGVPAVERHLEHLRLRLVPYGADWMTGALAAPGWHTDGKLLYVGGSILTAVLMVVVLGLFTYLALHATRPVTFASFVPSWGSITLAAVLVGLVRGLVYAADFSPYLRSGDSGRVVVASVEMFALHGVIIGFVLALLAIAAAAVAGRGR
jgi:hypothetical protein